ncbi:MAG: Type IV pilus assembly protein PilM [Candidatus Azambacteria bacterium GW2011_GWC2_45_7b]|uniref:Type IV pilus assembly protein PilM n=2 Tax=Parcubacteria group TaxID=1794811 RepID=A0A837ILB0_9BACT|nr:MAG: Type IV pilus assembly protein PilM [Parcubacteria group bacterium GW2011_GWC1_44_10]KKT60101.1 MAG: Type IV pilus assembly protein PilM [Candidatus Giovannonibacteria bacterium GW2011_GWA1_44_25]KKU12697.1 MAG: Type IV pilus assembly protein PilM [Candidatus Azambacteria bacterium GW2011_GWC2_45_7b]KKU29948.1 MAG: Type IV pilus assembly protein PilM [Candidatus Giovannonibacteria bacterium GW2011_GWB1_46_20]
MVDDFGEGEIATGVIERGEIKKKEVLAALLKELFAKKNIKFVAVSLPEEKGFLENVQLTGIKAETEIRQALELQLEEHIPLPPSEVVFDYTLARKEKNHFDTVISAFPKMLVDSYSEVFYSAGALPVLVESELVAAVRSLIPKNFAATTIVMDWGKTRISFSIIENGVLRFASTAPIGGETLDEAISKTLNVDLKKARELKLKSGFLPASPSQGGQNQDSLPVFQAIVPVITAIREEVGKYIKYWQTHSESKEAPAKLFLSGGDANLLGLAAYLQQELNIPVQLADPWANVSFPKNYLPDLERQDAIRFVASIGLSLAALDKEKNI